MEQKDRALIGMLENMLKGAEQLVESARREYAEVSKPESEKYPIRDLYYENLRYFIGNRDGISHTLKNIRKYYFEFDAKQEVTA